MIQSRIVQSVLPMLQELYPYSFSEKDIQVNQTKPEFEGDYTVVLFPLVKPLKKSPEAIGQEIGIKLLATYPTLYSAFNVIKGFLNLTIQDSYWTTLLKKHHHDSCFGKQPMNGKKVMVEYSSPNTNKPLHLGHLRNNFLGWSVAELLKANGFEVIKSCIVNDRGVHICKSMIAWQRFADGATPQTTGMKGDHFVGDYYVKFNEAHKREIEELTAQGMSKDDAEKNAPIMQATQQMLLDWEAGKPEVMELWRTMNGWVYEGFDVTYNNIGSDFDKTYYESNTYLLGKDIVDQGLNKGVFFKKEDGSIWIDLTDVGMDEKLVLRKDGTSVYITQDIGLAEQKYKEFGIDRSIYVIGDEQNYHMQVLKCIAKKLGLPYANHIYHLSYGMVELPSGRMKSREGTVVDADDLVAEMKETARKHTENLGKVADFTKEELEEVCKVIGLGAMKFYLLRVDPKKKMIFNPEESIDFHGFTGPFIQYTHARIRSIIRKETTLSWITPEAALLPLEKAVLVSLEQYAHVLQQAAEEMNPSHVANYLFQLAKAYNSFYSEHSVANAETPEKKQLRLHLSNMVSVVLKGGMQLLGIDVPERM